MKFKTILTLLITLAVGFTAISQVFAAEQICSSYKVAEIRCADDYPLYSTQHRDINVGSGSITNQTEFQQTYDLDADNGKYVNFYINNTGNVGIAATINGEKSRTFNPGEEGHIYLEVKNSILGKGKKYTFKAVPAKNGGKISINWIIAQRYTE